MAIGRALGLSVGGPAAVLVGRDTRRSGRLLESALAAGIASAGVDVVIGGVLPTPAVAELVAADDAFGAGVVIAAPAPKPADEPSAALLRIKEDPGHASAARFHDSIKTGICSQGRPRIWLI